MTALRLHFFSDWEDSLIRRRLGGMPMILLRARIDVNGQWLMKAKTRHLMIGCRAICRIERPSICWHDWQWRTDIWKAHASQSNSFNHILKPSIPTPIRTPYPPYRIPCSPSPQFSRPCWIDTGQWPGGDSLVSRFSGEAGQTGADWGSGAAAKQKWKLE
jgi:hypothetical protein